MYQDPRPPIVIQPPNPNDNFQRNDPSLHVEGASARHRFREFLRNYRNGAIFPYREALLRRYTRRQYSIEIEVAHLNEYDEALYNSLKVGS